MFLINLFNQFFLWLKKPQTQYLKTLLVIIINLWLLIIFWKIFIIEGSSSIVSNNKLLTTIEEACLSPLFSFFNLDVNGLDSNTIKMLILTFIIISANLIVLAFNQMLILGLLIGLTRYLYKMYIQINNTVKTTNIAPNILKEPEPIINSAVSETNWLFITAVGLTLLIITTCLLFFVVTNANMNLNNMSFKVFKDEVKTKQLSLDITNMQKDMDYKYKHTKFEHDIAKTKADLVDVEMELSNVNLSIQESITKMQDNLLDNQNQNNYLIDSINNINIKLESNNVLNKEQVQNMQTDITSRLTLYENSNKELITKVDTEVSIINDKLVDFGEKLAVITTNSNTLSELVGNAVATNDTFLSFKNITVKYLEDFSNIVIEAMEKDKGTGTSASLQLKKSLDTYDCDVERIYKEAQTPLNSTKASIEDKI